MSSDKRTKQETLVQELINICQELEWICVIPPDETDDGLIPGVFVGRQDWAIWGASIVYPEFMEQMEAYDANGEVLPKEDIPQLPNNVTKKTTLH